MRRFRFEAKFSDISEVFFFLQIILMRSNEVTTLDGVSDVIGVAKIHAYYALATVIGCLAGFTGHKKIIK